MHTSPVIQIGTVIDSWPPHSEVVVLLQIRGGVAARSRCKARRPSRAP